MQSPLIAGAPVQRAATSALHRGVVRLQGARTASPAARTAPRAGGCAPPRPPKKPAVSSSASRRSALGTPPTPPGPSVASCRPGNMCAGPAGQQLVTNGGTIGARRLAAGCCGGAAAAGVCMLLNCVGFDSSAASSVFWAGWVGACPFVASFYASASTCLISRRTGGAASGGGGGCFPVFVAVWLSLVAGHGRSAAPAVRSSTNWGRGRGGLEPALAATWLLIWIRHAGRLARGLTGRRGQTWVGPAAGYREPLSGRLCAAPPPRRRRRRGAEGAGLVPMEPWKPAGRWRCPSGS